MSNINFNYILPEVQAIILKDVIIEEESLQCRLVCKDWKKIVDEHVFKVIVAQLQKNIESIPTALGLRNIVIQFTDAVNPKNTMTVECDVQKAVQHFCTNLSNTIGLTVKLQRKKLITSAEEIKALTNRDTNLHLIWREIQKQIPTAPFLKTVEDISRWMSENTMLLGTIVDLDLTNVRLTSIPEEIKYLTNLKYLTIRGSEISEVPKEIGNCVKLQRLVLTDNKLQKFPKEIANCTSLRCLYLENNELKEIPEEIGNLIHLQILDLTKNKLKKIPKEIGNCTSLQKLYLNDNELEEIPKKIGNCSSLQHLWLANNKLKEIPKEIGNCTNLISFTLSDNKIQQIQSEALRKDPSDVSTLEEILNALIHFSESISKNRSIKLFKQLSENAKNKLAIYFYHHNQEKFIAANKNNLECAKETLFGNPYYAEFLGLDNLRRPIIELMIGIASSNDVKEDVSVNKDQLALEEYLSILKRPITWRNKEPVQLKDFALCGIQSLDDLNLLLGTHVGPSKQLKQITCLLMNWDLIEKAKSSKDLMLMQKAVGNTCSDFSASCSAMIAFINMMTAKTQSLDIALDSTEELKVVAGEIDNLNRAFQEATDSSHKVWEYFQDPSQWIKLQTHFSDILNKLKELELDHQSETISAYFDQHKLVSFWKQPENANKSLSQILKERYTSVSELFKLT